MAVTPSTMLPLNTKAPDFLLFEPLSNKKRSLSSLKSDLGTVIMFICNHCPFVKHICNELIRLANEYQSKGIQFIAINPNDAKNYPEDSPKKMKEMARSYPFPYLYDETQLTAKAYQAACTPDFYLFDKSLYCLYRGRFDESTPGNQKPVTGNDLRNALESLIKGKAISENQKPSIGCSIKWKE